MSKIKINSATVKTAKKPYVRKPLTQEQRDRKNRKRREKRAALKAAAEKAAKQEKRNAKAFQRIDAKPVDRKLNDHCTKCNPNKIVKTPKQVKCVDECRHSCKGGGCGTCHSGGGCGSCKPAAGAEFVQIPPCTPVSLRRTFKVPGGELHIEVNQLLVPDELAESYRRAELVDSIRRDIEAIVAARRW